MPRLTIELVPETSFFQNLRSILTKSRWDTLRHQVYESASWKCEICGNKGRQHAVECHEIWSYDEITKIQSLTGLIALCPACHEVKHIGLASMRGRYTAARAHLARINGWSIAEAESYIHHAFAQWKERSRHKWTLDTTWIEQFKT